MTTSCGLYQPGHRAHYIPVLKLAPSRPHHQGSARVERRQFDGKAYTDDRPDGDGVEGINQWCLKFTSEAGTEFGPFFHHDLPAVNATLGITEGRAELVEGLWLLRVPAPDGSPRTVFALSDAPIGPCDPTDYPDREWDIRRE